MKISNKYLLAILIVLIALLVGFLLSCSDIHEYEKYEWVKDDICDSIYTLQPFGEWEQQLWIMYARNDSVDFIVSGNIIDTLKVFREALKFEHIRVWNPNLF